MKLTIIVAVVIIILLREIVAWMFWNGEDNGEAVTLSERAANINQKLFHWHERKIEAVTVGWRKDAGQHERVNSNGVVEYYRRIR